MNKKLIGAGLMLLAIMVVCWFFVKWPSGPPSAIAPASGPLTVRAASAHDTSPALLAMARSSDSTEQEASPVDADEEQEEEESEARERTNALAPQRIADADQGTGARPTMNSIPAGSGAVEQTEQGTKAVPEIV